MFLTVVLLLRKVKIIKKCYIENIKKRTECETEKEHRKRDILTVEDNNLF